MGLPNEALRFFANMIEQEVGIVYSEVNYYQLETRLDEIAPQVGRANSQALWEHAAKHGLHGLERLLLIDIATNNETMFFRDTNAFAGIETILRTLIEKKPGQRLKLWSAACSTGQEPYSLAIMMSQLAQGAQPYSILASDISERVLERARKGRYTALEVQRGLSAQQLMLHFEQVADNERPWQIKSTLQRNVSFKKLNLLEYWPDQELYDLVLCRNVLIYQTVENKRKVIAKVLERLAPGGYLVLGGAESLFGITDTFHHVDMGKAVVYQKKPDSGSKLPASA